jgi:hypothetical protein
MPLNEAKTCLGFTSEGEEASTEVKKLHFIDFKVFLSRSLNAYIPCLSCFGIN